MIKIYNYNQIMQNEIEEFILNNIGNELQIKEKNIYENIKKHMGTTMVIKYGGNALVDKEQKENVLNQIALLKMLGIKVVVVHGGGPDIDEELKKENIEIKFEKGLRVTDKKTMDIVKNVLTNKTNPDIVQLLNEHKCNAIGVPGFHKQIITCTKIDEKLGFVGKIQNIKTDIIKQMLENNCIPVISPLGVDEKGNHYNINADTVAAEVAMALKAQKVIFITNTDGVLDKNKKLISLMNKEKINLLIEDETIVGGMIPKISACKECLNNGVEKTHILNGLKKNTILNELFSDKGVGTMII